MCPTARRLDCKVQFRYSHFYVLMETYWYVLWPPFTLPGLARKFLNGLNLHCGISCIGLIRVALFGNIKWNCYEVMVGTTKRPRRINRIDIRIDWEDDIGVLRDWLMFFRMLVKSRYIRLLSCFSELYRLPLSEKEKRGK